MADDVEDFSNEGLYRLIEKMRDDHGDDLKEIRRQTTITNSRVAKLETRVDRNDQELKRIHATVFPRPASNQATTPPTLPVVVTPEGESFSASVKMSPKMWAAIVALVSSLSIFSPIVADWLQKWLGQ